MINVAEAATSPGEVTEAGGEDGEVLVRVYSEDSAYVDTTTAPPDNRYTASAHCLYTLPLHSGLYTLHTATVATSSTNIYCQATALNFGNNNLHHVAILLKPQPPLLRLLM